MILSQSQTQQQTLSLSQQQSLKLLQLPLSALQEHLIEASIENPMVDLGQLSSSTEAEPVIRQDLSGSRFERALVRRQLAEEDHIAPEQSADPALEETFTSHLKAQLPQISKHLPDRYLPMCEFIIESLDRRGYLDEPIDLLAATMGVSVEDAMQALYAVQTLSPLGTGARSLEECLMLQLADGPHFNRYTLALVREDMLMLLAKNDFSAIAKSLQFSLKDAQHYCQVIRSLNPIPSNGFRSVQDDNHAVIPEALIERREGELVVHYNRRALPTIAVNPEYKAIMDTTGDQETKEYLKQNYQQVKKLQQDLEKRESTLVRLIQYILDVQKDYVLDRQPAPSPLSVQEIAQALDLHPSTISRAVKDKYITLNGHTFPLKNLLGAQIGKGIPVSREMLKICMQRILAAEDKDHPLSDASLSSALETMNIHLSRRTVALYREEFGIPAASRRKQL